MKILAKTSLGNYYPSLDSNVAGFRVASLPTGFKAAESATADAPKKSGKPPPCSIVRPGKHPLVAISKETTYITEPLRPDGYPDYLAALNQLANKDVTPENNAAVVLMQAFGPGLVNGGSSDDFLSSEPRPREYREQFYKMLGIAPLPDKGDYFVDYDDYIKKHAPEVRKDWGRADTDIRRATLKNLCGRENAPGRKKSAL